MCGGLYACCPTSPLGQPLENFLIDPPIKYLGQPFRVPQADEKQNRIYLWVGEDNYPFVSDFIEETRQFGISKRIPIGTDLSKFKPYESRMLFVHPRAYIERLEPVLSCPKKNPEHIGGSERCLTVLYYLIEAREIKTETGVAYERMIGDTTYTIPRLLPRLGEKYSPGTFMALPFSHFEYIVSDANDPADPRVQADIDKGIPIIRVKEE